MRPIRPDARVATARREARLFILLAVLLLLAALAGIAHAGECRAYDAMSPQDVTAQSYPSVQRSIPGWWRQQMKLQPGLVVEAAATSALTI